MRSFVWPSAFDTGFYSFLFYGDAVLKLKELIKNLHITALHADPEMEITGISYDSRKTQPGDLFVAICGFTSDGHRFIPAAVEKGAAAVLCERVSEQDVPYMVTDDARLGLALSSIAFYDEPARKMHMIGITGTSGKTTVSTILKHVLEENGKKVGLIGTNGIWIGQEEHPSSFTTPESLELQHLFRQMADAGCDTVVMEVSSHALELKRVAGICFDTAVYTNLSQDHLDFHETMEAYASAKEKLFHSCRFACINSDDAHGEQMAAAVPHEVLRYGTGENADLRAEKIRLLPDRVVFQAVWKGIGTDIEFPIPGSFSVSNALAVIAAAEREGISAERCAAALRTAKGVKGRLENVPTNADYHVMIDYSHKPDALEKVLKSLRPATRGRLICLFGCGGDRDRLKRPIMAQIAAENADFVILTSDNPRTEDPEAILDEIEAGMKGTKTPYRRICRREEAIAAAIAMAQDGDVILLAGKGHEDYQIVGHEKHHMDEREIVAEALAERNR